MWISLFLSFILILVLSGCSGLPKTAKINISINPNPVPYDSESGEWLFNLIFSESNGVGVTLISLRFDSYNQEEQLYYTQILYEEDIIDWFESNYLPAFSIESYNYNRTINITLIKGALRCPFLYTEFKLNYFYY